MRIFLLSVMVMMLSPVFAADLLVEEFGQIPAYSSVTAAVNAAQSGDRIIIKNRAGDIPWIENITINKSLQFLSFANDGFFVVQGDYQINLVSGMEVSFIGMNNTFGSITTGPGSADFRSIQVQVVDSHFASGSVSLQNVAFNVNVVGSRFAAGRVLIAYGNVIGNDIINNLTLDKISVVQPTADFQNDTCYIVGNKVFETSSSSVTSGSAVHISTRNQAVHVRNNYIRFRSRGINVVESNDQFVPNLCWNNTLRGESSAIPTSSNTYGIAYSNLGPGRIWETMNNVLVEGSLASQSVGIASISSANAQLNLYYNHLSTGWAVPTTGVFTFSSLNTLNSDIQLNNDLGTFSNSPEAIDGGNPAPVFFDLDLSTGDAGAYGGSFTLNNFFPLHTGAARVYHVIYPFNVRVGNTLDVRAFSFDR